MTVLCPLNGSRDRKLLVPTSPQRTSISFTEKDLVAIARLIQAGQVMPQAEKRPPMVARIKAAMTRPGTMIPYRL